MRLFCGVAALTAAGMFVTSPASAGTVTLEMNHLKHGEIVANQFFGKHGLTISGINTSKNKNASNLDFALAFDTDINNTSDPDLERPWARGNVDLDTDLGVVLIVPENNVDNDAPFGFIDDPDDEGRSNAGVITFSFERPIHGFAFTLVDIEENHEYRNGYFLAMVDTLGNEQKIDFSDFVHDPGTGGARQAVYDHLAGMRPVFGDHSINRIPMITSDRLGMAPFQTVKISFDGSGAVGGIAYMTPTPSAGMAGLALLGVLAVRRWRRIPHAG